MTELQSRLKQLEEDFRLAVARRPEHQSADEEIVYGFAILQIETEIRETHAAIHAALKVQRDADQPPCEPAPVVIASEELVPAVLSPEAEAERREKLIARGRAEMKRRIADGTLKIKTYRTPRQIVRRVEARAIASRVPRPQRHAEAATASSSSDEGPSDPADPPAPKRVHRATPPADHREPAELIEGRAACAASAEVCP